MRLKEIAERINAHLKRFEADKEINKRDNRRGMNLQRFWDAGCWWIPGSTRINVIYVSYQGSTTISKGEALTYLEWLDAGNVGQHYRALERAREKARRTV